MLDQIKQLLVTSKVIVLVGNSGTGKTYNTCHLINSKATAKHLNILITNDNFNFKHYCSLLKVAEYSELKSFTNFTLSKNQLVLTEEYDFFAKDCPKILEALKRLDNDLEVHDKSATLYLDDCPLQLAQEVVDYLISHSFKNMKTVITCLFTKDLPGIENFAQIKLERKRYV